jgi:hypothetical protein
VLGWESVYAYNDETFGSAGTLGRANERETFLLRDLRAALELLNPSLPQSAREQAIDKLTRVDLNDRIAAKVEEAELDPDQTSLLEKLLGKDYEVITADDRLDKLAEDFVEHCATRWEAGKSMVVCIDKITCGRMLQRIEPRWKARLSQVKAQIIGADAQLATATDPDETERLSNRIMTLRGQAEWMESTIIEIIISEAQNEIRDFKKWGLERIARLLHYPLQKI